MFAVELIDYSADLPLGDLAVALGTLLLAIFTATLAWQARKSIEAQDRPFVVANPHPEGPPLMGFLGATVGPGGDEDPPYWEEWTFRFRFWNIGKGPAIIDGFSVSDAGGELLEPLRSEIPVGVDAGRDEKWPVQRKPEGPTDGTLRIDYRDNSGKRYCTTSSLEIDASLACFCRDFRRDSDTGG